MPLGALNMTSRLRQEIKQTKPFGRIEEEVYLQIMRTADRLQYDFEQLMKGEDITGTQYNALRILRGAGADGLPCNEIGARMITRLPDVTRLLDRLEKTKLVRRVREKSDRRVVRVTISQRGLDLLARLDAPTATLHVDQLNHLTQSELRSLSELLEKARLGKEANA
jgi:DNA-binding MarR family transcriptional regulator